MDCYFSSGFTFAALPASTFSHARLSAFISSALSVSFLISIWSDVPSSDTHLRVQWGFIESNVDEAGRDAVAAVLESFGFFPPALLSFSFDLDPFLSALESAALLSLADDTRSLNTFFFI